MEVHVCDLFVFLWQIIAFFTGQPLCIHLFCHREESQTLCRSYKFSSDCDSGILSRSMTVSVISENAFHVSQAVFFTTLLKEDVVSHSVRAWKKGSALEFSRPSFFFGNRMYCNISIVLLYTQSNSNFTN